MLVGKFKNKIEWLVLFFLHEIPNIISRYWKEYPLKDHLDFLAEKLFILFKFIVLTFQCFIIQYTSSKTFS